MARHTKVNLLAWIKSTWNRELKLGLICNLLGDEEMYRKRLLYILRKEIEPLSAERIAKMLEELDVDTAERLWSIVRDQRQTKKILIDGIIANECGYNTEENVWADMDYDMSDEKRGKSRAWYRSFTQLWSKKSS